jgi:hypothetical protein
MEPTVYLNGRAGLVAQVTDAGVTVAMGLVMGNDGLGPLLDRMAADVGDRGGRALIAARARAKAIEGGVLELPG